MITSSTSTTPTTLFTPSEWESLRALRLRYQQDHDRFNPNERARLLFVRWLWQTGRI